MAQKSWAKDEPLTLVELPSPEPRAGEIRVAVKSIGVNPVDWKMRSSGPMRLLARLLGPALPFVPGVDFAGVVAAVGTGSTRFQIGQRVAGGTDFSRGQRGSYADTVVVREEQVCALPDSLDFETAGALNVAGITAWLSVVELGRIRSASNDARRVLVLGASGGVGQLAVQIAKNEGAFVAGVCSGKNAALVSALGADVVLDYTASDPLVQAAAHAPFQTVIDCAGGYSARRCRALLARGGRHVMVAGDSPGAIVQVIVPPFRSKSVLARPSGERLSHIVSGVVAGRLRIDIARRLKLQEAEEAHRLSRSGRLTGKIILIP